jgi:hypothetical protein
VTLGDAVTQSSNYANRQFPRSASIRSEKENGRDGVHVDDGRIEKRPPIIAFEGVKKRARCPYYRVTRGWRIVDAEIGDEDVTQ